MMKCPPACGRLAAFFNVVMLWSAAHAQRAAVYLHGLQPEAEQERAA